jgi:hypothetical protein
MGLIAPRDVVLVVEIVTPGSVRTDNLVKRSDYADAGAVAGVFQTSEPFPVRIDLDALI